MWMTVDLRI
jgi:hypothetical protein